MTGSLEVPTSRYVTQSQLDCPGPMRLAMGAGAELMGPVAHGSQPALKLGAEHRHTPEPCSSYASSLLKELRRADSAPRSPSTALAAACVGLVDTKDAGLALARHRLAMVLCGKLRERGTTLAHRCHWSRSPFRYVPKMGGGPYHLSENSSQMCFNVGCERTTPRAAGTNGGQGIEASIYISKPSDRSEWAAVSAGSSTLTSSAP